MAFIEVTKEQNPKLAVQVNNSLKYKDKEGNLHDRQKVTALTDVVREASSVASMGKGAVTLSLNTDEGFKNYFVNKTKNDDIALVPQDEKLQGDRSNYVYFNKKVDIDNPDRVYYQMSKAENAEKLVDSIKVTETEKSAYIGARVTLLNKELLQEMIQLEHNSGEKHVAILGKESKNIISISELNSMRDNSIEKQDKGGFERPKEPFKPKEKEITKSIDKGIER